MTLREEYEEAVGSLAKRMMRFPWENKAAYAGFLAQTFYYVRHSTKLLTLTASRFSFDEYEHHRRFIAHSQEERGHEFICLKDLSSLGYKIEEFTELTSTAAFYQRQYYLVEHVDPICFLGYILCLEGLSVMGAGEAKAQVMKHHAATTTGFLRSHSDEDPDHIDKAFKSVGGLPDAKLRLVIENLKMSCVLYNNMMDEAERLALRAASAQKKTA